MKKKQRKQSTQQKDKIAKQELWIAEFLKNGRVASKADKAIGVSLRTRQRWQTEQEFQDKVQAATTEIIEDQRDRTAMLIAAAQNAAESHIKLDANFCKWYLERAMPEIYSAKAAEIALEEKRNKANQRQTPVLVGDAPPLRVVEGGKKTGTDH